MNSLIAGPNVRVGLSDVADLLPGFGDKYPHGWDWLEHKLSDAGNGDTRVWLSMRQDAIAALAIESLKGAHKRKLSTFVVAPAFRGAGIGSELLAHLRRQWLDEGVDAVHVTIDRDDLGTQAFFAGNRFAGDPLALVPYGEGRWDRVYNWLAVNDQRVHAAAVD